MSRRREWFIRRRLDAHLAAARDPRNDRPHRHRAARAAAHEAEQLGMLRRPKSCENCRDEAARLQRHHPDHSQPLRVVFLCPPCHREADALANQEGAA